MRFQRFGDRFIVRLMSGEPVMETLSRFLAEQDVDFANISAAGAVSYVQLGYWNPLVQKYEYSELKEQLEVVSFQGNAALKDGKPFLHIHGVFGRRDNYVLGGHVKEAQVHPTLEVWLRAEDVPVCRVHDPATGLDLLDLPERSP